MTVFVDDANIQAKVGRLNTTWCHLTADSSEELIAFAESIGMRPQWIQCRGTWKEHFDVIPSRRRLAVEKGAVEVTYRASVIRLNRLRTGTRGAERIQTSTTEETR